MVIYPSMNSFQYPVYQNFRRCDDEREPRTIFLSLRPRQRLIFWQLCFEIQRCLVVWQLSQHQPEWFVPAWKSHLVRERHRMGPLAWILLFAEVHRDQNQTSLNLICEMKSRLTNCLMYTRLCQINITYCWLDKL